MKVYVVTEEVTQPDDRLVLGVAATAERGMVIAEEYANRHLTWMPNPYDEGFHDHTRSVDYVVTPYEVMS